MSEAGYEWYGRNRDGGKCASGGVSVLHVRVWNCEKKVKRGAGMS